MLSIEICDCWNKYQRKNSWVITFLDIKVEVRTEKFLLVHND